MHPDEIYTITPLGERELRSSATRLSAAELALLVRFDGELSLGQLEATLSPAARERFPAMFQALRDQRLLELVSIDPLESRLQADAARLGLTVSAEAADAGLASLQRSGFFVQIARERPGARRVEPGRPLTAVVVEDEPTLAAFVRSYLMLSGFEVRVAGTREAVVQALRQAPVPDLVLLDVMLPDADGFDILLRLRQHPVLGPVPVIMLTGKATRQAVLKGIAAGADGYVTKPFEPEALMQAVRTVLGLAPEPARAPQQDPWVNRDAKPHRTDRLALEDR